MTASASSSRPRQVAFGAGVAVQELGHGACIRLDRTGPDQYMVTNLLSLERKPLPLGEWELVHDELTDTCAVVNNAQDDQILEVSALMNKAVFKDPSSGELFIVTGQGQGAVAHFSLEDTLCRFRTTTLFLEMRPTNAKCDLECFVFRRPRDLQSRAFISLASFYKVCNLVCYSRQPSKWVFVGLPTWSKALQKAFGDHSFFIESTHISPKSNKKTVSRFSSRCAPTTCVGTCAALFLLFRWGTQTPRHGGFPEEGSRLAALATARTLTSGSCALGDWSLLVRLDAGWLCQWPRPEPWRRDLATVTLLVTGDGFVDLSPLQELAETPQAGQTGRLWWAILAPSVRQGDSCDAPLATVLQVACAHMKQATALVAQLVLGVATQLELVMGASCKQRGSKLGLLQCKPHDFTDDRVTRDIVDRRLLQYVKAGQKVAKNCRQFHLLTDKAWIGGLPMQMTVQTIPSGHAILCCPAVWVGPFLRLRGRAEEGPRTPSFCRESLVYKFPHTRP